MGQTVQVGRQQATAMIDTGFSRIHAAVCWTGEAQWLHAAVKRRSMLVQSSSSPPYLTDNLIRKPARLDVGDYFFEYRLRQRGRGFDFGDDVACSTTRCAGRSPAGPGGKRSGEAESSTPVARLHLPPNLFRRIAAILTQEMRDARTSAG